MEKKEDFIIPEDIAEWIGLKKSDYLSKLIELFDPLDFGFEDYHLFDSYIKSTLEIPDSTYEEIIDKQLIRTYLRSYYVKEVFHQMVIGVILEDSNDKSVVFIPILTFVTRKSELARVFATGNLIPKNPIN